MAIKLKTAAGTSTVGPKSTDYGKHLGPQTVQAKYVAGTVAIQKKGEQEPAQTEIPVHKAVVEGGCKVGCGGSRTVNLGNFESVKVSVWLEMPCAKDTVAETFDYVSEWVGKQLEAAVNMKQG